MRRAFGHCGPILGCCLLLAAVGGCSSSDKDVRTRTVDTTRAVEAIARGASEITYTRVPNDLLRPGEVDDGKSNYLPAKPFHTTDLLIEDERRADGSRTIRTTLKSKPSDFIDALLGGAQAIDAQKYAERNAEREFNQATATEWREWVIGLAGTPAGTKLIERLLGDGGAGGGPPSAKASRREQLFAWLADPETQAFIKSAEGQAIFRAVFGSPASAPAAP